MCSNVQSINFKIFNADTYYLQFLSADGLENTEECYSKKQKMQVLKIINSYLYYTMFSY